MTHLTRNGAPGIAGTMCALFVTITAGCATPPPVVAGPDPIEVMLDRHASDVAQSWRQLAELETALKNQHAHPASHENMDPVLLAEVSGFAFTGTVDDFLIFLGKRTDWSVLPAEGRRRGGAGSPEVRVKTSGGRLVDILDEVSGQIHGVADVVVSVPARSFHIRYRE